MARTWSVDYASKSQSPSSSVCLRRPAARTGFVFKRPAAAAGITDIPSSKRQPTAEAMEMNGYKAIEDTCEDRYRSEVCDLGLGIGWRDVKAKLLSWGYRVTQGRYGRNILVWLRVRYIAA